MSELLKADLINFIIKEAKNLDITSYQFGKNTKISAVSAHNILTGENTNPRNKTLHIMLDYLESKKIASVNKEPIADNNRPDLNVYAPEEIITHIYNNPELFKHNKMYRMLVESEIKDAVIEKLEESLRKIESKKEKLI